MDKAWIPKVIAGGLGGFAIGEALYWLFEKLILPGETFRLLKDGFVPVCVILGLLLVLYFYNRSKYEDNDDTGK